MAATTLLIAALLVFLAYINLPLLSGLGWQTAILIGFAMSFSSTVFAVKMLDDLGAALRLREMGYRANIAATTKYRDEEDALKAVGVDYAFNIYAEAGLGFANQLQNFVGHKKAADHNG